MPTLPSGLYVAIDRQHIMKPDTNWFRAPENHFWYWTPAPENPPPFTSDDKWDAMPANAPVPATREAMSKFIRVVIGLPNGNMYWQGDYLSDFPFFMDLVSDDLTAWNEWIESDKVCNFLDETILTCREQAAVNKEATGWVVIKGASTATDDGYIKGYKVIEKPSTSKL